jgi:hypothetical protein
MGLRSAQDRDARHARGHPGSVQAVPLSGTALWLSYGTGSRPNAQNVISSNVQSMASA